MCIRDRPTSPKIIKSNFGEPLRSCSMTERNVSASIREDTDDASGDDDAGLVDVGDASSDSDVSVSRLTIAQGVIVVPGRLFVASHSDRCFGIPPS